MKSHELIDIIDHIRNNMDTLHHAKASIANLLQAISEGELILAPACSRCGRKHKIETIFCSECAWP